MVVILALGVFFVFLGFIGFILSIYIKKTDPKNNDPSQRENVETAQEFLPFDRIESEMICLGNHKYRAVLECSSINLSLMSEGEIELIEMAYKRFLNSLRFPIVEYIQTRQINNLKKIKKMEDDHQIIYEKFPQLEEIGNKYLESMANICNYTNNDKVKKKFIIICFDEVNEINNLSDTEKFDHARKELINRSSQIANGLSGVGITAKRLNTQEIVELLFSTFHKDRVGYVDGLIDGDFLSMLVVDKDRKKVGADEKLDEILFEALQRLKVNFSSEEMPDFIKKNYEDVFTILTKTRENYAGYYKEDC